MNTVLLSSQLSSVTSLALLLSSVFLKEIYWNFIWSPCWVFSKFVRVSTRFLHVVGVVHITRQIYSLLSSTIILCSYAHCIIAILGSSVTSVSHYSYLLNIYLPHSKTVYYSPLQNWFIISNLKIFLYLHKPNQFLFLANTYILRLGFMNIFCKNQFLPNSIYTSAKYHIFSFFIPYLSVLIII